MDYYRPQDFCKKYYGFQDHYFVGLTNKNPC
nr:MAG TPA: hypothetical protein [Siphoviridae sp. ct7ub6]